MNHSDPHGEFHHHLQGINEELARLKHQVLSQLSQEIEALQTQKSSLVTEIQELEKTRQEQLIQQQQLIQKLTPMIVEKIQQSLIQQIAQQGLYNEESSLNALDHYHQNINHLINSLDSILRTTFQTLQQDLHSYQSAIAQQLGQMYTTEQRGEAILDSLVSRLQEELQRENLVEPLSSVALSLSHNMTPINPSYEITTYQETTTETIKENQIIPNLKQEHINHKINFKSSQIIGFSLILFSALTLYLQNIVVALMFKRSSIFGLWQLGGYLTPNFGNSLLILFLRMVTFVPCILLITKMNYPSTWHDLKTVTKNKELTILIIISGFFLFLSCLTMYLALGFLNAGIAVTIFFIFPTLNLLCSWLFFGEKIAYFGVLMSIIIALGVIIISFNSASNFPAIGIISAFISGIAFASHLFCLRLCTQSFNAVSFSISNFCVMLIFTFISLFLPVPAPWHLSISANMWNQVFISSIILGILSLLNYVANNIGINIIGVNKTFLFGSIGPFLTSFLAWIIIGQSLNFWQFLAILIVTIGATFLNLERLFKNSSST